MQRQKVKRELEARGNGSALRGGSGFPPQRRSPLHAGSVRKIAGMFVWIPNQKDFVLGGIVEIDDKLSNDACLRLSSACPGTELD